ncbi:MAG: BolA family transcriptional regulator, partial [Alphaproteobacteria bacterium]|nr:BolA family transcriptional regulator [Alphaproteobacteria bacterium]
MQITEHLEHLLKQAFHPTFLKICDDSAKHAGHREASVSCESHFSVIIVSEYFVGLSAVKKHQEVYRILAPLMN